MPTKPPPHIAALLQYLFAGQSSQSLRPGAAVDNAGLAQYMSASSSFMSQSAAKRSSHQSPSVISRVIDVLSRPNYAMAEAVRRGADPEKESFAKGVADLFSGLGAGLRGDVSPNIPGAQKTTFSDVLGEQGVDNKFLKYGGGLALDIALDPTTYIGIGLIPKIFKGEKAAQALVKPGTEFVGEAQERIARQQVPAAFMKARSETRAPIPALTTITDMPAPDAVARVMPKPRPVPVPGSTEEIVGQAIASDVLHRKGVSRAAIRNIELGLPERLPIQLNPAQQANMWNRFINHSIKLLQGRKVKQPMSPRFDAARVSMALKMLTAAEEALEKTGRVLVGWDGNSVRLGDVLAELPEKNPSDVVMQFTRKPGSELDPDIAQAIENARARSAMEDTNRVKEVLSRSMQERVKFDILPLSAERKAELTKQVLKASHIAARSAGASPAGAQSARNLLSDVFFGPVGSPLRVAERYKGRDFPEAKAALTRSLEKVLDPKASLKQESVEDWIMGRIATWWGQKDLRPLVLHSIGSALAAAERKWRALNEIAKRYTPSQIEAGWAGARAVGPSSELSLQMRQAIEDLTGILHRSGVTRDDINKHLARTKTGFQFTNKKITDAAGRKFDFSDAGEGWRESWKAWDPAEAGEDSLELLHRMTLAVENAGREKAVLDEIAERFGGRIPAHGARTKVAHHYLEGYYFPDEIASQITRVLREMDGFYDPQSPFMKMLDKTISAWKSGVTIYSPSHHIRNLIGDTFLSWIAGVNNPHVYSLAARVMRNKADNYIDMSMDPALMFKGGKPDTGGKILFRNKHGIGFTANQVYSAAFNRGLLLPAKTIEDIFGAGELIPKNLRPLKGRGQQFARKAAETREHYVRLAHFIHEVQRSRSGNLARVFDDAARKVRKWHPDGLDLTIDERRTLRRLAPFYSWTRKSIPLIIEGAVQKPAKTVLFAPRASAAAQGMLGIETEAPSDQFPVDQLFPGWIREKGIGPLGGTAGNYTVVNPGNPFMDLTAQFSNPVSGVAEMLNPAIRIPMEVAFGREVYSGAPITDEGEYLTKQLPIATNIQRILNYGVSGQQVQPGESQIDWEALLNWGTAAGYRETGKYRGQAYWEELEKRRREARG